MDTMVENTIIVEEVDEECLIQKVKQIAAELDRKNAHMYIGKHMHLDTLAFKVKEIACSYNCFISSAYIFDQKNHGTVEAYNLVDYDENDDESWGLIFGSSEQIAIVAGFKWLADRGYFVGEEYEV